jgi:hypothetical protein
MGDSNTEPRRVAQRRHVERVAGKAKDYISIRARTRQIVTTFVAHECPSAAAVYVKRSASKFCELERDVWEEE